MTLKKSRQTKKVTKEPMSEEDIASQVELLEKSGLIKRIYCFSCDTSGHKHFYTSKNPIHKEFGLFPYCKECMKKVYEKYLEKYKNDKMAMYYTCRKFDMVFNMTIYEGARSQMGKKESWTLVGAYMKQLNSFMSANNYGDCFDETGDIFETVKAAANQDKIKEAIPKSFTEEDIKNQEFTIRVLGYDPFIDEDEFDRRKMYNKLVDYLDESTLEDSFKVPIVVQIVTNFNQIEKIDKALTMLDVRSQINDIKNLTAAKGSIMTATLSMAKDNGISVNHSNNKSKGAGTLSGIIKSLQEKDIRESDINLYEIETLGGIAKVANISNRSILDQLMFDENSYTEMIKEQRALIEEYRDKAEKFEEQARKLRQEISVLKL